MTTREIIIALTIHLILPLAELLYFYKIKRQIQRENIVNAPTFELFIIFATYGGLLFVTLTTFFWQWSGLASLGIFYLILAAPIVMAIIAIRQRRIKLNSKYHNWTFKSALFYFIIAPVTLTILFLFSKN